MKTAWKKQTPGGVAKLWRIMRTVNMMVVVVLMMTQQSPVTAVRNGMHLIRRNGGGISVSAKGLRAATTGAAGAASARSLAGKRGKGGKGGSKGDDTVDNGDDDEETCNSDERIITTSVLIRFEGRPPETLTDEQRTALEEAFIVAYNLLVEETCEAGSFRVILSVTLDVDITNDTTRRQLRFGGFTFVYNVVWGCNDLCPVDAELLDNDAGRRLQEPERTLQDDPNACTPCEPPTPSVFLVTFNQILDDFKADLEVPLDITADDVTELEVIEECDATPEGETRETVLTIPFDGDVNEATDAELAAIADGALQTLNNLNALNADTCDRNFRVALSAEVVINNSRDEERRRLRFKSGSAGLVINIVWQCSNTCPDDSDLLSDDGGRRRLQVTNGLQDVSVRHLQGVANACQCPIGVVEFRPPTRSEFDEAFNETLTILINDEEVTFVNEIGNSTESEEINCTGVVNDQETFLSVEVETEVEEVQESDINELADIIASTYRELTSMLCDRQVRTIIEVVFVQIIEEIMPNRELVFGRKFTFVYNVVWQCRFCPSGAELLIDDAGRRRRKLELPTIDPNGDVSWRPESPRMLQDLQNDRCFCDVNFVNEARPPTVDEFTEALSDAIASSGLNFTSTDVVDTSSTLSPTTFAPITSVPTIAPTTAEPTTAPPVSPQPTTLAPTTSEPTTVAPTTVAPTTIAPTTVAPTPAPTTTSPISPQPTIATTALVQVEYTIAQVNGSAQSFDGDIVAAMDLLAAQVASETFTRRRDRRRLGVITQPPTLLSSVLETDCPDFIPPTDTCLQIVHTIELKGTEGETDVEVDQFRMDLFQAIVDGRLQEFLDSVNSDSVIYIVTGLTSPNPIVLLPVTSTSAPVVATQAPVVSTPAPVAPTNAPVTPQPVTLAPVSPTDSPVSAAPVIVPGTNERQICSVVDTGVIDCECREGWTGENGCFEDIQECLTLSPCDFPGGFCVEKSGNEGMYDCGCDSNIGWVPIDGQVDSHGPTSCQRANRCEEGLSPPCHMDADCIYENEPLAFDCICKSGFEGDGFTDCQPLPEEALTVPPTLPPTLQPTIANCDNGGVECPTGHRCDVTPGSEPMCVCLDGFSSFNEGVSACTDDNECLNPAIHGCDEFATCSNIPGSFFCECDEGYMDAPGSLRVGTDCVLRNECEDPILNTCDPAMEVCVDRPPPTFFECILITLAPAPAPAPEPTPVPTRAPVPGPVPVPVPDEELVLVPVPDEEPPAPEPPAPEPPAPAPEPPAPEPPAPEPPAPAPEPPAPEPPAPEPPAPAPEPPVPEPPAPELVTCATSSMPCGVEAGGISCCPGFVCPSEDFASCQEPPAPEPPAPAPEPPAPEPPAPEPPAPEPATCATSSMPCGVEAGGISCCPGFVCPSEDFASCQEPPAPEPPAPEPPAPEPATCATISMPCGGVASITCCPGLFCPSGIDFASCEGE